ncbi:uncharacterized protein LOC105695738 isoform X2 [Orussus abietinus]|nr:uncharacterized protein LOC105695738 isoform X2 [Orussus abietinus]XP_012273026.1 uncharacterized protein LOC105695738 isoform X2 [Orussus abietinus]XP_012273027.1 uncharacterized protein LOC105695738 isoform X2 [Orussus abietinus]XP_012273029.1 uncharacterized protein LOC105695738 isoform X2 [Orussus abietinus]XP_012273030.1 uncharacterized protein LOC105695738 isoform X2 [Orussus abietinus]
MGLKVGDVVVRLNDQSVCGLTHGQAHEALILAGNNFVLGVHRAGETNGLNGISEDNIVPYTIPLEELQPIFPEEILKPKTPEPPEEEKEEAKEAPEEQEQRQEEAEKSNGPPGDPSQDLTDEQIAQLILEEEELLSDKGLLGVNFKKLRPRAPLLKESKVFQELQKIAVAEPPRVQELKRTTTFLQKPQRPVPGPKKKESEPESTESYKVVIRKQQKKSVTERLLEKGLLGPRDLSKSPESEARSEVKMYVPGPKVGQPKPVQDHESPTRSSLESSNTLENETEDPRTLNDESTSPFASNENFPRFEDPDLILDLEDPEESFDLEDPKISSTPTDIEIPYEFNDPAEFRRLQDPVDPFVPGESENFMEFISLVDPSESDRFSSQDIVGTIGEISSVESKEVAKVPCIEELSIVKGTRYLRRKGRYLENYIFGKRNQSRTPRETARGSRLYLRGRYFEKCLNESKHSLLDANSEPKSTALIRRSKSGSLREFCDDTWVGKALKFVSKNVEALFSSKTKDKASRRLYYKARYFERFVLRRQSSSFAEDGTKKGRRQSLVPRPHYVQGIIRKSWTSGLPFGLEDFLKSGTSLLDAVSLKLFSSGVRSNYLFTECGSYDQSGTTRGSSDFGNAIKPRRQSLVQRPHYVQEILRKSFSFKAGPEKDVSCQKNNAQTLKRGSVPLISTGDPNKNKRHSLVQRPHYVQEIILKGLSLKDEAEQDGSEKESEAGFPKHGSEPIINTVDVIKSKRHSLVQRPHYVQEIVLKSLSLKSEPEQDGSRKQSEVQASKMDSAVDTGDANKIKRHSLVQKPHYVQEIIRKSLCSKSEVEEENLTKEKETESPRKESVSASGTENALKTKEQNLVQSCNIEENIQESIASKDGPTEGGFTPGNRTQALKRNSVSSVDSENAGKPRKRSLVPRPHYVQEIIRKEFLPKSKPVQYCTIEGAKAQNLKRGSISEEKNRSRRASLVPRPHYVQEMIRHFWVSGLRSMGLGSADTDDTRVTHDKLSAKADQCANYLPESFVASEFRSNDSYPQKPENGFESVKKFISSEIFHRGERRFFKKRGESDSFFGGTVSNFLKNLTGRVVEGRTTVGKKKAYDDSLQDNVNRRMSFVPTVIYEELTNRIGVDFTRLFVYAFVPSTSIVLLYMYRE